MAKKYHQSMKDRKHESEGMERHDRKISRDVREVRNREVYAGYDSRRELEMEDYYMIHEDHRAMANLPQEVMMKEFPKKRFDLDPFLDDTQTGIDKQIGDDTRQMHRHISKTKY